MAEERTIVKTVKNAVLYSDGTIRITDVRISYPHLDRKWAKNPGKDTPAYSGVFILPKATHQEAVDLCLEVCDDILKERNKGAKIKADVKFVRDGDLAAKPEYEDAWTVNARETDNRPIILNPDKSEMEPEDIKGTIKAGFYTDVLIQPWWQDNEHGKRINASLRAVRYRREGPALSEGGISKDDAIGSFDDDDDGGFGGDDDNGGL